MRGSVSGIGIIASNHLGIAKTTGNMKIPEHRGGQDDNRENDINIPQPKTSCASVLRLGGGMDRQNSNSESPAIQQILAATTINHPLGLTPYHLRWAPL